LIAYNTVDKVYLYNYNDLFYTFGGKISSIYFNIVYIIILICYSQTEAIHITSAVYEYPAEHIIREVSFYSHRCPCCFIIRQQLPGHNVFVTQKTAGISGSFACHI